MKIVLCSAHFPHCSEMLQKHLPNDTILSYPAPQVLEAVKNADVVVPTMHRVDAAIIRATSATMIHQFGVGLEGVDIPVATERGIYVANVPGHEGSGNAASVAEHAIFLMLALARKFPQAAENVHKKVFGAPMGRGLLGKTVAIIDYASFPAIFVMSMAASVLGNRTSIGDCARIESRTFGSRRITPASGGENFRNPSQAFKIVL